MGLSRVLRLPLSLVRVSMELSFHDESSMMQASIGSLPFIPDISILNSISESGTVDEKRRHEDFENQLSDGLDIQTIDK